MTLAGDDEMDIDKNQDVKYENMASIVGRLHEFYLAMMDQMSALLVKPTGIALSYADKVVFNPFSKDPAISDDLRRMLDDKYSGFSASSKDHYDNAVGNKR